MAADRGKLDTLKGYIFWCLFEFYNISKHQKKIFFHDRITLIFCPFCP